MNREKSCQLRDGFGTVEGEGLMWTQGKEKAPAYTTDVIQLHSCNSFDQLVTAT